MKFGFDQSEKCLKMLMDADTCSKSSPQAQGKFLALPIPPKKSYKTASLLYPYSEDFNASASGCFFK